MNTEPLLLALGLGAALAGCANSPEPSKYQGLAFSGQLSRTAEAGSRRTPYAYEPAEAELARYHAIYLDPVVVYRGPDHQFGTLTPSDTAELVASADRAFRAALSSQGLLASAPGQDVARLTVTLTGAQASVPVLATATRLTPAGLAMSGLTAATGGEGRFSGVVMYAVELRDQRTGRLLWGYVTKQYPNALNIAATIAPLDAAKEGLKEGADAFARSAAARMGRP